MACGFGKWGPFEAEHAFDVQTEHIGMSFYLKQPVASVAT
jgi:hypothetical protein